ncbi:Hypothetical predicted protein [Paramuricea clavata]|uniref:Uncharacterized protein n=1 Tax=Paramuricea clavata TaxID=317549 RepID=A0A7D9DMG8_PARCT|nr:Hypothetical predicted protein [Paramuricea clavata]
MDVDAVTAILINSGTISIPPKTGKEPSNSKKTIKRIPPKEKNIGMYIPRNSSVKTYTLQVL